MSRAIFDPDYPAFLTALKERIIAARTTAARAVNRELVLLYWDIGRGIIEKQQTAEWGDAVVELLAKDLRDAFPEIRGFSTVNVWRMRRFAAEHTSPEFLAQLAREIAAPRRSPRPAILSQAVRELVTAIPWGHHINALTNLLNDKERGPDDQPSIGIILCAEKDDIEVEYALRTKTNPIGVAEYELQAKLLAKFKGHLPTAKQLAGAVRAVLPHRK
ncbi:MAG TPA: PDDEXK nuclease domain-containing protein [Verrucomicrobiota bacterium]|nr:PDDEXK nuclease domain-containing protein [Verrucomicrobiota bacterium]